MSELVQMLETPTGCVPPSLWEMKAAKEIKRLRRALQRIADLPEPDKATRPLRRTHKQIAIAALRANQ